MVNFIDRNESPITGICRVEQRDHGSCTFYSVSFCYLVQEQDKKKGFFSDVPESYEILFLQGGGTGQFAAVPLNLTSGKGDIVDYLVTGTWSNKAGLEAEKYATVNYVLPKTDSYTSIAPQSEWKLSSNATYFYYTDNETVHGQLHGAV